MPPGARSSSAVRFSSHLHHSRASLHTRQRGTVVVTAAASVAAPTRSTSGPLSPPLPASIASPPPSVIHCGIPPPAMPRNLSLPPYATLAASSSFVLCLLCLYPAPAHAFSPQDAFSSLEQLIAAAGPLGPAAFILAYTAAAVLLVPGSVLTLAAGLLFGPLLGTAVVSVAATSGAAAAFLIGRYAARPAVEARVQADQKFAAIDAAIGAQGPKIVFLLRLSPLFPYTLLNYGLSVTSIEFWPYLGASWAGMLPGTLAYVALGDASGKVIGAGGAAAVLPVLGAAASLAAAVVVGRAAAGALAEVAAAEAGEE